jgi:hypothetical protein
MPCTTNVYVAPHTGCIRGAVQAFGGSAYLRQAAVLLLFCIGHAIGTICRGILIALLHRDGIQTAHRVPLLGEDKMAYDTYATLINKKLLVPSQKTNYLAVDRNFFVETFAKLLSGIHVDERWYVSHSPDVGKAIERGEFASALDHYVKVGYYEHRMPYEIEVNEEWYLDNYPDIAAAVRQGVFPSGRAHFYQLGYREGRFPHPNFRLRAFRTHDADALAD